MKVKPSVNSVNEAKPLEPDLPLVPLRRESDIEVEEDVSSVDGDAPWMIDEPGLPEEVQPLFICGVCGREFSSEQIYDAGGSYICGECFLKSADGNSSRRPEAAAVPKPADQSPIHPRPPSHPVNALLARVTCPHCWHRFPPQDIRWVSRHSDLMGDWVLGPEAQSRFLPTRFNPEGDAVDARGMICALLACPRCHLLIPRTLLEIEPLFVSIIGVSGSGKSYFLSSMAWELRRILPKYLGVAVTDTDPALNRTLNHFEEMIFLQDNIDRPVQLEKTDVVGSQLYDQVRLRQQVINLPKPFVLTLTPSRGHPQADNAESRRLLCLYDNAGEHFNPGEDQAAPAVTQHLSRSRVILFLFDPTQDARFRSTLRQQSRDPQLDDHTSSRRQETILTEASARMRRYAALAPGEVNRKPLLVVVPKADVWGHLVRLDLGTEPLIAGAGERGLAAVDVERIEQTSASIRQLLLTQAPEFVAAADAFSTHVIYIPVSALGCSPQQRDEQPGLWICPRDIRPRWVTTPVLYMLAKWSHGLIFRTHPVRSPVAAAGPDTKQAS